MTPGDLVRVDRPGGPVGEVVDVEEVPRSIGYYVKVGKGKDQRLQLVRVPPAPGPRAYVRTPQGAAWYPLRDLLPGA